MCTVTDRKEIKYLLSEQKKSESVDESKRVLDTSEWRDHLFYFLLRRLSNFVDTASQNEDERFVVEPCSA